MRSTLPLLLSTLLLATAVEAQDVRYISDKQYIPVRSGAGNDYRITHRGLPSGTRLTVKATSGDGVWSQITTDRGTSGWVRSQYLMTDTPAQNKLDDALRRAEEAAQQSADLAAEVENLKTERVELLNQITSSGAIVRARNINITLDRRVNICFLFSAKIPCSDFSING